jgi:hypothetical protein
MLGASNDFDVESAPNADQWIDSCCIDKTSSSELSEAINSMFNWYRNSQVWWVPLWVRFSHKFLYVVSVVPLNFVFMERYLLQCLLQLRVPV